MRITINKGRVSYAPSSLGAAEPTPVDEDNDVTPWKETKPAAEESPAVTGYEKTKNGLFPKTASYDGKWTVKGFSIVDAQGKVAFAWDDKIHAITRKYHDSELVAGFPASHHVGSVRTRGSVLCRRAT